MVYLRRLYSCLFINILWVFIIYTDDDSSVASSLHNSVRVLCWVMTSPDNLQKRAKHVQATWGRRCNVLLFISDKDDADFPAVGVNVSPGRTHLASKTERAFYYITRHHYNDADWFLKADDDTYVIMENLRYMLSEHAPTDPVYFGYRFQDETKQSYFSGGAGYVLSKEALRIFASRSPDMCDFNQGAEDLRMGICMENMGVKMGNSRDRLDRSRFHPLKLSEHLQGMYPDWFEDPDEYGNETVSLQL